MHWQFYPLWRWPSALSCSRGVLCKPRRRKTILGSCSRSPTSRSGAHLEGLPVGGAAGLRPRRLGHRLVGAPAGLRTSVLESAMASSTAVTPFSSVTLGIAVCGERLAASGGDHVASAALGLAVTIVSIVLPGSAEGPMAAEPASEGGGITLALRPRDVP